MKILAAVRTGNRNITTFTGIAWFEATTNLVTKCELLCPDVLSDLTNESRDERVGVFVCGPESMKVSVASFCKNHTNLSSTNGVNGSIDFHSLSFYL